jgi:hypothetical protein
MKFVNVVDHQLNEVFAAVVVSSYDTHSKVCFLRFDTTPRQVSNSNISPMSVEDEVRLSKYYAKTIAIIERSFGV